jgi:hypothetical protein
MARSSMTAATPCGVGVVHAEAGQPGPVGGSGFPARADGVWSGQHQPVT